MIGGGLVGPTTPVKYGRGTDARYRCRSEVVGMAIGLVIVRTAQTVVATPPGVVALFAPSSPRPSLQATKPDAVQNADSNFWEDVSAKLENFR